MRARAELAGSAFQQCLGRHHGLQGFGDELGSVVRTNMPRHAAQDEEIGGHVLPLAAGAHQGHIPRSHCTQVSYPLSWIVDRNRVPTEGMVKLKVDRVQKGPGHQRCGLKVPQPDLEE